MRIKFLIMMVFALAFFCGCNKTPQFDNTIASSVATSANSVEKEFVGELFANAVRKQGEHLKQAEKEMFVEESQFAFYDVNKDGKVDLLWSVPNFHQYDIYLFLSNGDKLTQYEVKMQTYYNGEKKVYPVVDVFYFLDGVLLKTNRMDSSFNVRQQYFNYYKLLESSLENIASVWCSWKEVNNEKTEVQYYLTEQNDESVTMQEYEKYNESLTAESLSHAQIVLDNHIENYLTVSNLDEYFDGLIKQMAKENQ